MHHTILFIILFMLLFCVDNIITTLYILGFCILYCISSDEESINILGTHSCASLRHRDVVARAVLYAALGKLTINILHEDNRSYGSSNIDLRLLPPAPTPLKSRGAQETHMQAHSLNFSRSLSARVYLMRFGVW